jgi:hypothetical protein
MRQLAQNRSGRRIRRCGLGAPGCASGNRAAAGYWRRSTCNPVRITIRATGYNLRLRRSPCGKAAPFRRRPFLYNLFSAA